MKVKRVRIGIRSMDQVLDEAAATMKALAGGKRVRPLRRRQFFTSPQALRSFLTPKRLELIRLIRQKHPASITDLAVLAGRDFKRVYEDVMALANTGLVDLTKHEGNKLSPRVADELRLEVVV